MVEVKSSLEAQDKADLKIGLSIEKMESDVQSLKNEMTSMMSKFLDRQWKLIIALLLAMLALVGVKTIPNIGGLL